MSVSRVKILILGPLKSGKTQIADIIGGYRDTPSEEYRPTIGCRIVEFVKELQGKARTALNSKVTVELWDCSGDPKYEKCWSAVQNGAHGIIFVYDPTYPKTASEMSHWVSSFPKAMKLPPAQCMAFVNNQNPTKEGKTPPALQNAYRADANFENTSTIFVPFEKYFNNLMKILADKMEKELMNM